MPDTQALRFIKRSVKVSVRMCHFINWHSSFCALHDGAERRYIIQSLENKECGLSNNKI
jgi:hypothetical protein